MRIPDVNIISTKVFDKLTKSQQAAILQAGEEATAYMRGAWKVAEVNDLEKIKGLMKEVITVDKKPFQDAVAPLVKEEAKKLGAERIRQLGPGRRARTSRVCAVRPAGAFAPAGRSLQPSTNRRDNMLKAFDRLLDGITTVVKMVMLVMTGAIFFICILRCSHGTSSTSFRPGPRRFPGTFWSGSRIWGRRWRSSSRSTSAWMSSST